MLLVTATSTLLVLLCLTTQSTAQVDCTALANAGDCSFYDCLNIKFQCGPTDYPLAYGKRYCLRFASKSNCFTAPGQAWISGVRRCLMQSIITSSLYRTNNATCEQLKDFAFNSHPSCYVSNGFCSDILVSPLCQNVVCLGTEVFVWRDFINKQALEQVVTTSAMCYSGFWSSVTTYLRNAPKCNLRLDFYGRALVSAIYDYLKCNSNSLDIVIVLDSSGSIGGSNFQLMKTYIVNMLSGFTIGSDGTHVGVITYSADASIAIPLGYYDSYSQLSSAITSIIYDDGLFTYTNLALNLLSTAFANARVDEGVPRVAIVFTDGQSTSPTATVQAAQRVHNAGIYVYSFGIGRVSNTELTAIASGQNNVFYVSSFSASNFEGVLKQLQVTTCATPTVSDVGTEIVGKVTGGGKRLFKYVFSKAKGLTVKVGIILGNVLARGSFSVQNPTELTQDFVVTSNGDKIDYFISPELYEQSTTVSTDGQRRKRQATTPTNATNELTLYLSIVGLDNNNTFSLNTTIGDTTASIPAGASGVLSSVALVMAAIIFVLFV